MGRRSWERLFGLGLAVSAVLPFPTVASPPPAPDLKPQPGSCASAEEATAPDVAITACTAIIQSKIATPADRASASFHRGYLLAGRKEYRRAIADYTEATLYQQIVAAGGSLPFGILVTEPPAPGDGQPATLRATKWFADVHALTVIPSIQSLQFLRGGYAVKPRRGVSAPFAGYGDPLLEGEPQVSGPQGRGGRNAGSVFLPASLRSGTAIADITQLKLSERLPGTAIEMENMRVALGAPRESVHVQSDATEAAIKRADLAGVRVLAFATHGLMAGELPGSAEPGLVFTLPVVASETDDGLLTASEISGLKLDADWVILSACNTAAGDGTEGAPGLSGLARAFFYAGARNLLVSHWPVRDDVASRLTVETIKLQRITPGLSRAEALQQAMRAIRDDTSHDATGDTWAHPSAWGPFSLIGDGAQHDGVVGHSH